MQTVYEALGGDEGVQRLARAWHERVMADDVVSHAFMHGFEPDHTERLAAGSMMKPVGWAGRKEAAARPIR